MCASPIARPCEFSSCFTSRASISTARENADEPASGLLGDGILPYSGYSRPGAITSSRMAEREEQCAGVYRRGTRRYFAASCTRWHV